jgi:uncharacterized protein YbaR (Trm112 family)
MLTEEILKILCCPESRQRVRYADRAVVEQLNSKISSRTLKNRAGNPVAEPIEGALLREDGKFAYPIRKNIPIMLIDEALPLT